jgi:hypothetical protein
MICIALSIGEDEKYCIRKYIKRQNPGYVALQQEALPRYNTAKIEIIMDVTKYQLLFSQPRFNKYVYACNQDVENAIALYKYNIQASQALYPLISIMEVALRNGIDRVLISHFNDNSWLLTQRHQFAYHSGMVCKDAQGNIRSDNFFAEKLKKTENKLSYYGTPITHGKLLAELTFGFWVKFFDTSAIKVLRGAPLDAFANKPHKKLALVHSHLNAIVTLRNRIAHNEPICFNNTGNICLTTIESYETNILEALGWLDTDLKEWSNKINFFKPVYNRIIDIFNHAPDL